MNVPAWKGIVERKRHQRDKILALYAEKTKNVLNVENATSIIELSTLLELYRKATYSAVQVIQCYISKAIQAHQATNCLTEVLFDSAIVSATQLDQYFKQHGQLFGPLHGVPITLKDQFNVQGVDSSIGYVSRAFSPAREDAAIVKTLKKLGAIIIAKTNLPQSIMWCETENFLWGLTTNPRDSNFTPGGSSGGEGALLALEGSLVGWGTDIGGSVRIPSHMNGLWGLKPSSYRLPYRGVPVSTEGQQHVPSAIGPMTRSLQTMVSVMKGVLNAETNALDPNVVPILWRESLYRECQSRPLTFGVLYDDGVVRVHPPVARILNELVLKLEREGHEVIEWQPTGHAECIDVMDRFYTVDGCEDISREIEASGEPYLEHVKKLVNNGKPISVYQYWQMNKEKIHLQQEYSDRWSETKGPLSNRGVDVILAPTMPHCAVPHRMCRWVGYTKIWNVLDYPALSFPAGQVIESDCRTADSYEPRNEHDKWNWDLWDPSTMEGHPVGLQIVGKRFEEEKVLGVAEVISRVMSV